MSQLPPQTVTVKRKRDEEAVDTLIVENQTRGEVKRRVAPGYIFRRQDAPQRTTSHQVNNGVPVIRTTLPGQESVLDRQLRTPAATTPEFSSASAHRRFHLSGSAPIDSPRISANGATKREGPVFTEKRRPAIPTSKTLNHQQPVRRNLDREERDIDMTASPLRRPGSTTRLKPRGSKESIDSHNSVAITPNEPPPSQLLAEMERFAAEVESSDVQSTLANGQHSLSKLKYKPKAPPLRYKDRHPDTVMIEMDTEMMDVDSDEGDFVYDTYVREPDTAVSIDEMNGNIGILVITEEDQEVWESYIDDDDSDKDWNSEEEDENAEDYYGADYPEDEVDSDDERDVGAYKYRHGASDDEEFDSDTGAWSDEGRI
ncbi:hypothetical protein H2199_006564 [Coniosporium tulheliwenetii]|uniref:Uncharacterized protein n=1 Tax=Coniosporium tulheliwenetii TaxID=3383036 RepID=A0ACC2YWC5_9PEZI|nr:hypothetical protein H2199_006564 [Cladosporium sp. JES 115]